MFNLNKLMKLVKNGKFFSGSFNIKKKARNEEYNNFGTSIENVELDLEVEEDEASKWLSKKEVSPVPSGVKVKQPSSQVLPKDVDESMFYWIKNNLEEINYEGKTDLLSLIDKKDKYPDESTIGADISLSKELTSHPEYQDILSNKINEQFPVLGKEKSDIFVQTMLAKAQLIIRNMGEAQSRPVESQPAPIAAPAPIAVPEIEEKYDKIYMKAYKRFLPESLSDKEKIEIQKIIDPSNRGFYDGDMLGQAMEKKLSPPKKPGHVDQRMNFFLRNPQLLLSPEFFPEGNIFQKKPTFEQSLREGLRNFGIADSDISIALGKAYRSHATDEVGSAKKPITEILKAEAEPELLDILSQLIDRADPIIAQWFQPALSGAYKGEEGAHYTGTTEEGKAQETNLQGDLPSDNIRSEVTEGEMDDTSKQIASFTRTFLSSQLRSMNSMKESTVQKIMLDNVEKYKTEVSNLPMVAGVTKKDIEKQMQYYLKNYTRMEGVHAFSNYAIEQLDAIFNELGRGKKSKFIEPGKKESSIIEYRNRHGLVGIPREILKDVYGVGKKDRSEYEGISIDDYDAYAKLYQDKINSGEKSDYFKPDWKYMINSRMPYNAFADLYDIKMKIKDYKEKNPNITIDLINKHIDSIPETSMMLKAFSGISLKDSNFQEEDKKKSFIYMTLNQKEEDLKTHKDCYEAREKYRIKRNEILADKNLSDKDKREKIIGINAEEQAGEIDKSKPKSEAGYPVRRRSILKQMKGNIGDYFWPMLPSILKNIQQSNPSDILNYQAMKDFIKLFDHTPSRYERYEKTGQMINQLDDQKRTNTELYYLITEGKVPPRIQQLMEFTEQSAKEKGKGWYSEFFAEYRGLLGLRKKEKIKEELIREKEEEKKDYMKNFINYKVNKIIQDTRSYKKVINRVPHNNILEFQTDIDDWNGFDILPDEYYLWLGLKGPVKAKNTKEKIIQKYRKNVGIIKEEIIEIEKTLKKKLQETGKEFDIYAVNSSALKMVYAEYKRSISKIDRLSKIKESSYKFACINTTSIDDTIKEIKNNFDNLFNSIAK